MSNAPLAFFIFFWNKNSISHSNLSIFHQNFFINSFSKNSNNQPNFHFNQCSLCTTRVRIRNQCNQHHATNIRTTQTSCQTTNDIIVLLLAFCMQYITQHSSTTCVLFIQYWPLSASRSNRFDFSSNSPRSRRIHCITVFLLLSHFCPSSFQSYTRPIASILVVVAAGAFIPITPCTDG